MKSFKQILSEASNLRTMSPAELRSYLKLASSAASGGFRDRTPEQMDAERHVYSGASRSNPAGWYGKITKRPSRDSDTLGEFGTRETPEESEFVTMSHSEVPEPPETLTPTGEVKMSIGHGFGIQEPSTPKQDLKSILDLHKEIDPQALDMALDKSGISKERYRRHIKNIRSALKVIR
jgi:hypothetical protein